MSTNFVGKVVVITGASSRLGEATARLLSAQGASVALGARRVDRLKSLADELIKGWRQSTHGRNRRYQLRSVKQLVDAAVQKLGRIDIGRIDALINNAGLL
jgi:NADP-dependent 3-hydroxy acid dehydrogenase YdfG